MTRLRMFHVVMCLRIAALTQLLARLQLGIKPRCEGSGGELMYIYGQPRADARFTKIFSVKELRGPYLC